MFNKLFANNKILMIDGLCVELYRKNIKNLHLRVFPPDGKIKISAPVLMPLYTIKQFIKTKSTWIKTQQNIIQTTTYKQPKQFINGELHYFLGDAYSLKILMTKKKPSVVIKDTNTKNQIILFIKDDSDLNKKLAVMDKFYRQYLKKTIPNLINKYQPLMGVLVAEFGIKKMKTRWGTCNPRAKRIWLNLSLAQKSPKLLEYVVVHEMVHLLEASHNHKFIKLMNQFMPDWQIYKQKLNASN